MIEAVLGALSVAAAAGGFFLAALPPDLGWPRTVGIVGFMAFATLFAAIAEDVDAPPA